MYIMVAGPTMYMNNKIYWAAHYIALSLYIQHEGAVPKHKSIYHTQCIVGGFQHVFVYHTWKMDSILYMISCCVVPNFYLHNLWRGDTQHTYY